MIHLNEDASIRAKIMKNYFLAGKYVSHADETLLQFPNGFPKLNENDKKMSIILNSLWADIASGR